MLLGRTVQDGQMKMTSLAPFGILTPKDKHNPYITAYFNFDFKKDVIDLDSRSYIGIMTGSARNSEGNLPNPMNITSVYTIESVTNAMRNGIYISAEDINKRKTSDRRTFTFTLFLGVIVTMVLDNLVSLIRKWRVMLHQRIDGQGRS